MILQATRAIIDTKVYAKNIASIKKHLDNKILINVVKANAYGHGIIPMSIAASKSGVDYLAVATVNEAVELRESGIAMPIILLFPHALSEAHSVVYYDLIPVLSDNNMIKHYEYYLKKYGKKLNVHIKVDTGLGRMGVEVENVVDFAKRILSSWSINITGITTHFASADSNTEEGQAYLTNQIASFNRAVSLLEKEGVNIPLKHTANSGAVLYRKDAHFDAGRFGLISYGYKPNYKMSEIFPNSKQDEINVTPIMNVLSKIVLIRKIAKGKSVSYGMTWTANRDSTIAIIPIGYADGLPRELSNKGKVKIKGNYYPIVGRVCMDSTMIDITDSDNIEIEDDVLIYGNDSVLNAVTLAETAGSISYDILTSLGSRIKREYI